MLAAASAEYFASVLALTETLTEYETLPSTMPSSTPRIVTVCGVLQLAAEKVSDDATGVPSVVSLETIEKVTLAVGCVARTTVNVACPPASVVVSPLVGVTVMPGFKYRCEKMPVVSPVPLPVQTTVNRPVSLKATEE